MNEQMNHHYPFKTFISKMLYAIKYSWVEIFYTSISYCNNLVLVWLLIKLLSHGLDQVEFELLIY